MSLDSVDMCRFYDTVLHLSFVAASAAKNPLWMLHFVQHDNCAVIPNILFCHSEHSKEFATLCSVQNNGTSARHQGIIGSIRIPF